MSTNKPLYVSRVIENAPEIIEFFKSQGFSKCVPPEKMHVTILYSKDAVVWEEMGNDLYEDGDGRIIVPQWNAPRSVTTLGDKGSIVLNFQSTPLAVRHNEMIRLGASHGYPSYKVHTTLTYEGDPTIDLTKILPWDGPIILGREQFAEIIENFADTLEEATLQDKRYRLGPFYYLENGVFTPKG